MSDKKEKYIDNMKKDYSYPEHSDEDIQYKLYKKREFYFNKIPTRPNIKEYKDIKEYRDVKCNPKGKLPHQVTVSNFINPETPYRGLLLFHGLGTGKCLEGNSLILVNNKLITIKNIWNHYKTNIITDNEGEWALPKKNLFVNSYDSKNNKMVLKKVDRLYREKVNTNLRKIFLDNGMEIITTFIHKFLKNDYSWTNNINIGDYILIPNKYILYQKKINNSKYEFINSLLDSSNIPDIIFKLQNNLIKYYLDNYLIKYNLNNNNNNIKIKNVNKENIIKLYSLLKYYNINSSISCENNNYYLLINLKENHELIQVRIKNIKYVKCDDYVYDLEIQDTHNFVANGILCHNTCAGIAIAEKFKPLVKKYGNKIHILVPGRLLKENWKEELLNCTGETYMKYQDKSIIMETAEKEQRTMEALADASQYYKIMSYKSFYKRVLGEKIRDKIESESGEEKVIYRKTEEGEFERDLAVDRIYSLDNTLLIVDEAHNIAGTTGNVFGESVKKIIQNSKNLKIVLLTATPMKNLATDIIELLNFIRPSDSQIEKDKIFTQNKIDLIEFKEGGEEYLRNMARGYISHIRGADPLEFATRNDIGEIPPGLLFTKLVRCKMSNFQKKIYEIVAKKEIINEDEPRSDTSQTSNKLDILSESLGDTNKPPLRFRNGVLSEKLDALDRKTGAIANFVFPGLSSNKELVGLFGREGLNTLNNQLKQYSEILNNKISKELFNGDKQDYIYLLEESKKIMGKIYDINYLKVFSTKFYEALNNLNKLVYNKVGAKTAFVYCNLVKVGIEIFQDILIENGYLEYQEEFSSYQIKKNTVCYYCGETYDLHKNNKLKNITEHEFYPATFVSVTGSTGEEGDELPEDKKRILKNVFSSIDNVEGKYIKLVLGSRVMNEGISLKQVGEVHILDAYWNFGKIDQTVGRAIRWCSHYKVMNEDNPFPEVKVYKYVISYLTEKLTTEEELYQKAERKFILIKKVERLLKEVAIDCPLNVNGNMFNEEIEKYKDCKKTGESKKGENICPAQCDYMSCSYKCDNQRIYREYYDPNRNIYKSLSKNDIDMTTFTQSLARDEINYCKNKIKEMYLKNFIYNLDDITKYIKKSFKDNSEKLELFDEFFVYKALDELIPTTTNDFNNFKDTIVDKFNRQGYIIYVNNYYIFQPFDQNENITMAYRTTFNKNINPSLSLYNYIKSMKDIDSKIEKEVVEEEEEKNIFDMDYYDNREENNYIGIMDKGKYKNNDDNLVFKIRDKRKKLDKKRGKGLQKITGAICYNAEKEYIEKIAKSLGIKLEKITKREVLCEKIQKELLRLEKYSKGKNKKTYMMVPIDNNKYPFPYNLEDRADYYKDKIEKEIKYKVNIKIQEEKDGYKIIIKDDDKLEEYEDLLKIYKAEKNKNEWIIKID
jgi:hypothetical protein